MQVSLANRQESLLKTEQNLHDKINAVNNNSKLSDNDRTKQLNKLNDKLTDVQSQITVNSMTMVGISQLGESETAFTFNKLSVTAPHGYISSQLDGTIIINHEGNLQSKVHEITHAIQYNNGFLEIAKLGTSQFKNIGMNVGDLELEAYRAQYSANGILPYSEKLIKGMKNITIPWLNGIVRNGKYLYPSSIYK